MRKISNLLAGVLVLAGSSLTAPVLASDHGSGSAENNFHIKIGQVFFSSIESSFLFDTAGAALSTNLDLGRDLDMEDSKGSFLVEVMYRLSEKSRLDFTYYEIELDGSRVIDREITFGDETFSVNSLVNSQYNYKTLIATYSYLFHKHDEIELGISAGLHVNDAELALSTSNGSINESVRQLAPLPVVGVLLNYDLSDRLTFNYQTLVFLLDYDGNRGNLTDSKITLEYRLSKSFSIEAGYNRRGTELEVRDPDTLKKSDSIATGWLANVIWHF